MMRYKLLGRSGLRVSQLCLGTMTFGEDWGWGSSADEARKIFEAYVQAGGNFIDTANYYTGGNSERILAELIAPDRERYVLATKYTLNMRKGDPNAGGNHRKNMVQAVEASLKRLRVDYIDLYWVHAWDYTTPIESVLHGLDMLVRSGKVLHIGISDTPAWLVSQANTLAELRGWARFEALQIEYSLIQRTPERDLLPMAQAFGMTVTPWSPLGSGILTGKYDPNNLPKDQTETRLKEGSGRFSPQNFAIAEAVRAVAQALGATPAQVALAWLRHQNAEHIPILGARRLTQLQDNLASLQLQLGPEHLAQLDAVSKIDLGFPRQWYLQDYVQDIIYGGTQGSLDFKR